MQFITGDWLVDQTESTITNRVSKEVHKIEPIMVETLSLLASNSGQIVSHQELIDKIWKGRIVTEHVIYRVITKLRKALDPNNKKSYIQTVSKRGYKYINDYEEVIFEKNQKLNPKDNNKNRNYKSLIFSGAIVTLLFSLFFILPLNKKNSQQALFTFSKPLTSRLGVEKNPVYIKSTNNLLFTAQGESDKHPNIYSQNIDTGIINPVTNNDFNEDNLRATKEGQLIVFSRKSRTDCKVILLKKLSTNQYEESQLFPCNHKIVDLEISSNGEIVYFIQRIAGTPQIFSHNIKTNKKNQLSKLNQANSLGEFVISLSPDNENLAFARYPNWEKTTVGIINTNTFEEKILFTQDGIINSFAWSSDSKYLYYKSTVKSISAYSLEHATSHKIFTSLDLDLEEVHSSPFQNSLLIEKSSNARKKGLWELPNTLINKNPKAIPTLSIFSSTYDLFPSYANTSDKIAFTSLRTGAQQIWIKDTTGKERKITNFKDGRYIKKIAWSPDDTQLLSDSKNSIYTIDINTGREKVHINKNAFGDCGDASWSKDGRSIYFYSNISGTLQIHKLDLSTQEVSQITQNSGVAAFTNPSKSNKSTIYVLKPHQDGLWEINMENLSEKLLFSDIANSSNAAVSVKENIIYYYSNTGKMRYYDIDKQTSHDLELAQTPDIPHFSLSADESTFIFSNIEADDTSILLLSATPLNISN